MNRITALEITKVIGCVGDVPKLFFSGSEQACFDYCMAKKWVDTVNGKSVNLRIIGAEQAGHC